MNLFHKQDRNKADFLELFTRFEHGSIVEDFNEIPCTAPDGVLEMLNESDDYERELFKLCSIPYTSTYLRYFYAGYKEFAEFLALWHYGLRNLMTIETIMKADKKYRFSDAVFDDGMFATYFDSDSYEEKYTQTCFSFMKKPWLYKQIRILLNHCGEAMTVQFVTDFLRKPKMMKERYNEYIRAYKKIYVFNAIVDDIIGRSSEKFLYDIAIPRIKKDGFTKQVYSDLEESLASSLDEYHLPLPKTKITYSDEEKKLEWKYCDYTFFLPEKAGIVYRMNNKMFDATDWWHDFRVVELGAVEIFVKKGLRYKAAIELEEYEDGSFELVAIYLRNKKKDLLSITDYEALKLWCKEKKIFCQ